MLLWCRLCAGLLGRVSETNVKGTTAADPASDPGAQLIYILNSFHIPLFFQFVYAQSALPAVRDKTEALGIQCQDIEWFSRAAMLKITLQVCTIYTSDHYVSLSILPQCPLTACPQLLLFKQSVVST